MSAANGMHVRTSRLILLHVTLYWLTVGSGTDPSSADALAATVDDDVQPSCSSSFLSSADTKDSSLAVNLAPAATTNKPESLSYDFAQKKENSEIVNNGSIHFGLRYDFIHRVLMLHIVKCDQLITKNRNRLADTYVKGFLLPERKANCKTKMIRHSNDPDFDEMFAFDVPYESLGKKMLQFTVYDFDRFGRHDVIGSSILCELLAKSDLAAWTEYSMQITGSHNKDDYGELLLYLGYSQPDKMLVVTVSKATNLRPMDITGASDPYVKIELIQSNRRKYKRRTTIKFANLNPVYNETLEFPFDEATDLKDTYLFIQVMDWDRIGKNDLLGCSIIGPNAHTTPGEKQWNECFQIMQNGSNEQHTPTPAAASQAAGGILELPSGSHSEPLRRRSRGNVFKPKVVGMWHSLLAEVPPECKTVIRK